MKNFAPLRRLALVATVIALNSFSVAAPHRASATDLADVADYDAEMARVERQFSNGGPTSTKPAPTVWSSRLEIRWNARWQAAPHFAV